ncbi:MAG: tryptophan synthase subunit alpha [Anaerolineae bacterium]|nr:tryptophan synthase subunit alpha [Thermoflexales bacterium]MDW8406319.1 tryptophan synthase subunit alpha [Anaerolineae bacterium]
MGLSAIQAAFARARAENRPALMPFWTLGYPDGETSLRVIEAIARAGADMIELGVPFSDPLADGPVIQHASQTALEHGITVRQCIELARALRRRGVSIPLFAMGYLNPLLAFGEEAYVEAWREAGADGFIVPDLPPEESDTLGRACAARDLALVQFTAPTSTEARIALAAARATGFIYVVSVTGVTGARDRLAAGLREYVERVKANAQGKPVVVGFGVSKPEHVREIGQFADGVISASALIRAAGEAPDPAQAAYEFVKALRG